MSKSHHRRTPANTCEAWLRRRYDQLWSRAFGRIRSGKIDLDRMLQAGTPDQRRGLTVIARPSPAIRKCVASLLRELHRLEPEQYYYHPSELHLTLLSLFTATDAPEPFLARKVDYIAAVDVALKCAQPIDIPFEGITASPGAVMVQGFFATNRLNELRERLRRQLRVRGLNHSVDERYRLQTAHMTVARFRAPLRQSETFARALEEARTRPFGVTTVRRFILVENDWYMSRHATQVLKRYGLVNRLRSIDPAIPA